MEDYKVNAEARTHTPGMKIFWISWWIREEGMMNFECHFPWYRSGMRESRHDANLIDVSICAAILARDSEDAKLFIHKSFDRPGLLPSQDFEFRFCEEQPEWDYTDRFPKQDWHIFPKVIA